METAVEMITVPQIKKIWYESRQLGLTDEEVHEMIESQFGVTSVKELTKRHAIFFIDKLVEYTGNTKHRPGMASQMQLWRIEELRKKLEWSPKGLNGYLKKYAHVEDIKWLTTSTASNVITGLTKIYKGKSKSESKGGGKDEAGSK